MKSHYFASCPRGLETILLGELNSLGVQEASVVDGGIKYESSTEIMYRANLSSRIATRILYRIANGAYETEDDVYNGALKVQWTSLFDLSNSLKVSTTGVKCPLKSLDFMTLRIKDAICDQFRSQVDARPNVDIRDPDIRIHLYLNATHFDLYIDTSGQPLYQRGFRKSSVEAPIRENLAAGILALSGWESGEPLLDPMCGSGTFLIEAAMIAFNQAPGLKRSFGFENWKDFDSALLEKIKSEYQTQIKPLGFSKIYGSDEDLRAIRVTKTNLEQAGLKMAVELSCQNFNDIKVPSKVGVLITNPPYGERIGEDEDLAKAYPLWASTMKKKLSGWRTYFLTSDLRMPKLMRLSPSKKTPLYNGALDCRLFEIKMVAGSNRI
ncbi:class I SAM-dependent RNA methyltransferase [Nitrosomonadales bacterium]|nr:class I SAM-dependent RNA methyltransferase [Nitrosomonadales bacterium]